jgi:hypothetical protein
VDQRLQPANPAGKVRGTAIVVDLVVANCE